MNPVVWQRIEGASVFVAALSAAIWLEGTPVWWAAFLIFFAPDLSFVAYLVGPKVGALVYNAVHIYGFGAVVAAFGILTSAPFWVCAGLLFAAHAGFDRLLGYGLKLKTGFKHTHLGTL